VVLQRGGLRMVRLLTGRVSEETGRGSCQFLKAEAAALLPNAIGKVTVEPIRIQEEEI